MNTLLSGCALCAANMGLRAWRRLSEQFLVSPPGTTHTFRAISAPTARNPHWSSQALTVVVFSANIYFSNSSNSLERDFTATLAAKRLEWAEYLIHGRLMRPPTLLSSSLPPGRLARPAPDKHNPNVK